MKNNIKDLAAKNAIPWGTIAEKIDENFQELEGNIDEEVLEGYIRLSRDFSDDFNNDFAR